jgi:hypothetical protein
LGDWKRYTARTFGIEWQRDFFDHRVRDEAEGADKWAYIRENPVRAGLVGSYDEWAHVWLPHGIGWGRPNDGGWAVWADVVGDDGLVDGGEARRAAISLTARRAVPAQVESHPMKKPPGTNPDGFGKSG